MTQFFKSILDQDVSPIVICDLQHTILYMNPAAVKQYGPQLLGKNVLACHSPEACERIEQVLARFGLDDACDRVHTMYSEKDALDVYMVALRDEQGSLIGYYEKLESRRRDMTPLYQL